jgi:transposase-like protein
MRKQYTAAFKARVVQELLKEDVQYNEHEKKGRSRREYIGNL